MKKLTLTIFLFAVGASAYGSPQQRQEQVRPRAAARRSVAENAVYGFYVKQFQEQGEVTHEVFGKVLPFIDEFIHERFEISSRRSQALRQLRQAMNRNGSDEDLKRLVHDVDTADAEFQANQERFFKNVDPLLTPRQQGRMRLLQIMADNQIRQVLNTLQNPGQRQNGGVTTPD